WITVQGLRGQVRFTQSRGREGSPTTVELTIVNRWPWPAWGLSLARGFGSSEGSGDDGPGAALAMVGGWSTRRVDWTFRPGRRGVYPLEAPALETAFPFGLYRARKPIDAVDQLIVHPARTTLDALPDAVEIEAQEQRGSDRRAGDVGDVLGARWFRQGDSLRRVHWAQSARQGRLIVCERQQPAFLALRVVLDLEPAHHGGVGREASLERLIRVAASIVESMHAQHAQVEYAVGPDLFVLGASAADLRKCLDRLSAIPARGVDACGEHGPCCGPFRGTARRHRAATEFVVTTARGFARSMHQRHWAENHHFIVVGAEATPTPADCATHDHCRCRPWLELPAAEDALATLPRLWQRACRVA
ncbi:MAG: DUF58 domain-containing protein, partial [Planctomycetia bacterium]